MPLPAATLPRLRKLIPVLSSDKAGEVVATAGAITRTLSAAGASWFDLAAQLTEPECEPPPRRSWRAPPPDAAAMLDDLLGHPDLSAWERDFVESVYGQYRRLWRLSDRQLEVLERIWRKVAA
jgi:hypothetical protein